MYLARATSSPYCNGEDKKLRSQPTVKTGHFIDSLDAACPAMSYDLIMRATSQGRRLHEMNPQFRRILVRRRSPKRGLSSILAQARLEDLSSYYIAFVSHTWTV